MSSKSDTPNKKTKILNYPWILFRMVARRALGLDWLTTTLLERLLDEPLPEITPELKYQIEQAHEDDLEKFINMVDEAKYKRFKERFMKGKICFMALDGKQAIAFSWISLDDEYETVSRVKVRLNEKEAYLFDDYVLPEYRNKGLQSALIMARLKYVHNLAYRRALALVSKKNIYAFQACVSTGFKPIRIITMFRIMGLCFHRWK